MFSNLCHNSVSLVFSLLGINSIRVHIRYNRSLLLKQLGISFLFLKIGLKFLSIMKSSKVINICKQLEKAEKLRESELRVRESLSECPIKRQL